MFDSLICKVSGHRVNRRRVWDDGVNFRTNCERCDKPLIRDKQGWRVFDSSRDLNPARRTHPRHA